MKDDDLINLIARCALRDQHALKQLYDRLSPWLNAVAFRILKSAELSNDVLQEAFVQIWNNAASYRQDKSRPLTWICSILRYRALDRLELERKHQDKRVVDDDLHALDKHLTKDSLEETIHKDQVKSHIHTCLQSLNNRIADCIKLAYLYGYTRDEIAKHFAIPPNTIKSWLRRGGEKLKECLETRI